MHASIVLAQDFREYAVLFIEIADAYFQREMYAEARQVYDILGTDETVCALGFYLGVVVYANTS